MIINHNLMANNAIRNMNANSTNASKSMAKLSSGLRINGAADDAAGLAISEKMRGQISGLDQASSNAQDSISMVQSAEGALNETTSILQRMRELSVQAGNDTATDSNRKAMQDEVTQLKSEIDRISTTTEFNTKKLLNGSLSAATTAQGTVAASSQFNAASTEAKAGASNAGLAVSVSSAITGKSGTGYSQVGGAALADKINVQSGVNDKFDITINGKTTKNVAISASPTGGYTRQQFVDALNTAVKNAVADSGDQFNQALFSLTSDNHLKVTTAATGSSSKINVSLAAPTAAASESSLSAMGFAANATAITGTATMPDNYKLGTTTNNKLDVTLGNGSTKTVDLEADGGLTAGQTYTADQIKSALQTALDKQVGQDAITVGKDANGHLQLTSNVATQTFTVANHSGSTEATDLLGAASKSASTGTAVTNTNIAGTSTVNGTAAGTYISAGANDEFNISVDGGATQTITLKAGNYATQKDLVDEVNKEINNNNDLVGKVTAKLDNSGKIDFVSNSNGSSSSVNVTAPTSAKQSALGALGYAGHAGQIDGTADLKNGVDLNGAGATKLTVTLGNKTATIDLAGADGIATDSSATSGKLLIGNPVAPADLSSLSAANDKVTVTIDGTAHDIGLSDLKTLGSSATKQDVIDLINKKLDGAGTASLDGTDHLQIVSTSTGSTSSVAIAATGTDQSTIQGVFGLGGADTVTAGTGANQATAGTITSDGTVTTGKTLTSLTTNDTATITIDGTDHVITDADLKTMPSSYTKQDVVDLINKKLNGAGTASLDGSNKLQITSATTGKNSTVAIAFGSGTDVKAIFGLSSAYTTTNATGSPAIEVSSRDAVVSALQNKLDDAFGKGAVTVSTSTDPSGTDKLVVNSNTRGAEFSVAAGAGAFQLFGGSKAATVGTAGVNVEAAGTDAINNTLSNDTLVTNLSDKDGNNLGLKSGNIIKITGTQNGDAFETSLKVTDTTTLSDIENSLRNLSSFSGATVSLDASTGKLSVNGASGSTKDISNLAFSAQKSTTDTTAIDGFNKQFANFNVTQQAADNRSDNSIVTQIGANQGQTMNIDINDMGTKALKVSDIDVSTQKGAETATTVIDNAIQSVSAERSKLGAFQNRLEHTINNLGTSSQNLTSAESRIRDVDMAKEMSTFSKNNILTQAAQAMLAQANQQPQQVLQLLK